MSAPKKHILESHTTQNALGGNALTATLLLALIELLNLDIPPEVIVAVAATLGPVLGRLIAWMRG